MDSPITERLLQLIASKGMRSLELCNCVHVMLVLCVRNFQGHVGTLY